MPDPDFEWVQGDMRPVATDTLELDDGSHPDMTGATVQLTVRSLTSQTPLALTGAVAITDPIGAAIQYTPSAADTAVPGQYMGQWKVTFPGPTVMRFPTRGYLSISIHENLETVGGQQLVSLPEVKDYLNVPSEDRTHDEKLLGFIEAAAPVIENIVGPVLVRTFDEWHDGGNAWIQLRRRPSTALGTSPLLTLMACSEYNGPIEWSLKIVPSPEKGQIYSCMLDARRGRVVRRTAGGGVQAFPGMPDSVHVIYQAGQQTIPANVRRAALELIRVNYRTTQPSGRGLATVADLQDQAQPAPIGFLVPGVVRELLVPMKRYPSFA